MNETGHGGGRSGAAADEDAAASGPPGTDGGDRGAPVPETPRRNPSIAVGGVLATVGVVSAAVLGALYETGSAPFGGSGGTPTEAIADAARAYVDAMNSQQVDRMRKAVCPADRQRLAGLADGEPVPHPVQVQSVSDISVDGDTATGTLSATADGDDGRPQHENFTLGFEKDGGAWRVCQAVIGSRGGN